MDPIARPFRSVSRAGQSTGGRSERVQRQAAQGRHEGAAGAEEPTGRRAQRPDEARADPELPAVLVERRRNERDQVTAGIFIGVFGSLAAFGWGPRLTQWWTAYRQ